VIWHKPNVMPSSVRDRPTTAHEYIFLLSKRARYYYDQDAIREPHQSTYSKDVILKAGKAGGQRPPGNNFDKERRHKDGISTPRTRKERAALLNSKGRNKRSIWTVTTRSFKGAHFAVFPPELIEPCVLAGAPENGIVLDPFLGSGTTTVVTQKLNRRCIGIELNPEFIEIAKKRITAV